MAQIKVQIDSTSLERSQRGLITGIIFFDFENYQFPEIGWNDFVVVVLCWWLSSLTKLVNGRSDEEHLRFMDGPLYINIKKLKGDLYCFDCYDERKKTVMFTGQCNLNDILSSVLKAAKNVYSVCSNKRWSNDDINELGKLIETCALNK